MKIYKIAQHIGSWSDLDWMNDNEKSDQDDKDTDWRSDPNTAIEYEWKQIDRLKNRRPRVKTPPKEITQEQKEKKIRDDFSRRMFKNIQRFKSKVEDIEFYEKNRRDAAKICSSVGEKCSRELFELGPKDFLNSSSDRNRSEELELVLKMIANEFRKINTKEEYSILDYMKTLLRFREYNENL